MFIEVFKTIRPELCADLSHKAVRNSVNTKIMEELAMREGWRADHCNRCRS